MIKKNQFKLITANVNWTNQKYKRIDNDNDVYCKVLQALFNVNANNFVVNKMSVCNSFPMPFSMQS